jgi:hypothetical protein
MSNGPGRTFFVSMLCVLFFVVVVGVVVGVGAASLCYCLLCCCIGGPHGTPHRFISLLLICPWDRVALFLYRFGVCCSL